MSANGDSIPKVQVELHEIPESVPHRKVQQGRAASQISRPPFGGNDGPGYPVQPVNSRKQRKKQ